MADGAQSSLQIDVRPGETIVLEIVATPKSGSVNERGLVSTEYGALEIQMLDEQGNPVRVENVYLIGKDGKVLEVTIDAQGFGAREGLPAGDYEITLQKPVQSGEERLIGHINFGLGQTAITADSKLTLGKIIQDVIGSEASNRGIHRVTAHGYACNTPSAAKNFDYSYARALAAKTVLEGERTTRRLAWLEVAMEFHGDQPGDSEPERANNRRVDVIHRPPAKT